MDISHCPNCGAVVGKGIPQGDDRERFICTSCSRVHYINPKVIVGSVCFADRHLLLCRRAIEPRRGFWTIPAGFMEIGETAEQGAIREAREEANASIEISSLLATYSVPHVGQIQLLYLARLVSEQVSPGYESLEVRLCTFDQIPWQELAFPTVRWALERARQNKQAGTILPPERNPGGAEPIRDSA